MSIDLIVNPPVMAPSVWLIPYAQLKATARAAWQAAPLAPVMPQVMTVREWAKSLGVVAKAFTDIHFDSGIDRLIAEQRLASVHLDAEPAYVQRLLTMVYELAPILAAIAPNQRAAWVDPHVRLFSQGGLFQLEGAIGLIALAWAAETSYDTDVLWQRQGALVESSEHFYISAGLQADPLVQNLLAGASHKTTVIELGVFDASDNASPQAPMLEYSAQDAEDLVQQTAALVLGHTAARMALVAVDRQITRRISSVLSYRGIDVIDETGWALSTTTVAAQWLAWLEAMAHDATSDKVLAALKAAPLRFAPMDVSALESRIRSKSWVQWSQTGSDYLQDWPRRFAKPRPLADWLKDTQALMQHVGLWEATATDLAGQAVLQALHLAAELPAVLATRATPMTRMAYTAWVRAVLEADRFRLKFEAEPVQESESRVATTVTILPLAQTWGRHFDAVVVPSCDERHLPARPHQQSDWSAAQREALLLPSADAAMEAQAKAWDWLCAQPSVHLLWQHLEGEEALQKSSLLQTLEMEGRLTRQTSPLLVASPTTGFGRTEGGEQPDVFKDGVPINWQTLSPTQLSASSYADLRDCPYRFYAKNILGLQDIGELDETVEKRDFGNWLHGTLYRFHEALKHDATLEREAVLNACAQAEQKAQGLDDAAFLPFALVWPKTRDAYLAWLAWHEAKGGRYLAGEIKKEFEMDVAGKTVKLVGKLDRIDADDSAGGGALWLLDYKTESLGKTKKRIGEDVLEDTQLAFYAALVSNEAGASDAPQALIRAAYVNLVERAKDKDSTSTHELANLEERQGALLDGIWSDLSRMADGHGLRALGEGAVCSYCQVRGLCRKDFQ